MAYHKKRSIRRTHRRRSQMKLRNARKPDGANGVRDHSRPRPNGKKIRVTH